MRERKERKEDVGISFQVYCNGCDFTRDFIPLDRSVDCINDAMDNAVQIANFHSWKTGHDVDVKVERN